MNQLLRHLFSRKPRVRIVDSVLPTFGSTERDGIKLPHVTLTIVAGRRRFFFRFSAPQADTVAAMMAQASLYAMAEASGFANTKRFRRDYGPAPGYMREAESK